jgi:kanamycin kinase/aminoglycoside 3'-phosphotransferase-2
MIENWRQSLPPNLATFVKGCDWRQIHVGMSSTRVFHLKAKNQDSLYLKIDSRNPEHFLRREKAKLEWIKNRLPVPKVVLFTEDENAEYLLLSEISGTDASSNSRKGNEQTIVKQMADGLKMIHSLPIENCPFDMRLDYKIKLAEERMKKGSVDENDFDEERIGRKAEELFRELIETVPADEDLVFTHGDYCLPNIILEKEKLSGFVDWGNAGVADKYQDIALLTRSVKFNFGASQTNYLFDALGLKPDLQKIRFYTLLDEFF